MMGYRQVPDDETVAKVVQRPGLAIDDPVVENDLTGKGLIEIEERLHGVLDLVFQQIGDCTHPGTDLIQIPFQALLVM
jgi:hypothetical protein